MSYDWFSHANSILLLTILSLFINLFFPTLFLEESMICTLLLLLLKFCCQFSSIKSSLHSSLLSTLKSCSACRYVIIFIGVALLFILWRFSNDISLFQLVSHILRALLEADNLLGLTLMGPLFEVFSKQRQSHFIAQHCIMTHQLFFTNIGKDNAILANFSSKGYWATSKTNFYTSNQPQVI